MITEYHETTNNTIYYSDSKLFSSSNPKRVIEFDKLTWYLVFGDAIY